MTTRELLLRTFGQKETERIPVAPFIHINFVKEFSDSDDIDIVCKTIDVYKHFDFDLIHRNCTPTYNDAADIESDNWQVRKKTVKNGRDEITTSIIQTPQGILTEEFKLAWISRFDAEASPTEYLIKSERDFELFEKYQPPIGIIDTSCIKKAKKLVGDKGIIAPWIQGAFNYVAFFYRKLDDLILDAMTNSDFYHRMMKYFLQRNKQTITQFVEAGADALSYGANIANGKMVGRDFFQKFVFDYEKELIDFIHSMGVFVQFHNCGYASNLLQAYKNLNMDVYESLTPPPFGDTILEDALRIMPNTITLSGNIDQIEFLKTAKPQNIKSRVKHVLEKVKRRGNFILSTTDYFDEGTPYENILALSQAGRKFGEY